MIFIRSTFFERAQKDLDLSDSVMPEVLVSPSTPSSISCRVKSIGSQNTVKHHRSLSVYCTVLCFVKKKKNYMKHALIYKYVCLFSSQ